MTKPFHSSHNLAASRPPVVERLWPSLESHRQVRAELHERLYDLEFLAFEQIMKSLLYKSGYLSVHLIGRTYKRGRTARGGLDLTAYSVTELASSLTIAQVKQYRRPVSRRFVDELRGVMLRTGAEQGLLLTLSHFPAAAHQAAQESRLAPIRLIEGEEVLDLLLDYRIGVAFKDGQWQIDQRYLDKLQETCRCTYRKYATFYQKNRRPHKARFTTTPAAPAPVPAEVSHPSLNNPSHALLPPSQPAQPPRQGGKMIWGTHLMAGLNSLWLLELTYQAGAVSLTAQPSIGLLAGAAALGSLLPDLDASESKLKHLSLGGIKPLLVPSQIIHRQWGHRSLLHSLLGFGIVATLSTCLITALGGSAIAWHITIALLLGYASHLVTDACTKNGIALFYPRHKRFHLLPPGWRVRTGSQAEEVIFVLLALSALLLFLRDIPFAL